MSKIPEEELLATIEHVVSKFYSKFRFGFFEADDIKQQIRLFALEAYERFNPNNGAPLEHFLTVHVRNRLINFRRDNYYRAHKPCFSCPFYDAHNKISSGSQCSVFDDKSLCDKFVKWETRNTKKKNLMSVSGPSKEVVDSISFTLNVEDTELVELIKQRLPLVFRSDYLRLLQGCKVPKSRRDKLFGAIQEILKEIKN